MTEHAKRFSASSADRWVRCAKSTTAIESFTQKEQSSVYAEEGTRIHKIAAQTLEIEYGIVGLNTKIEDNVLTDEDMNCLNRYFKYIDDLYRPEENEKNFISVETKLSYDNLAPTNYDTTDDFFGTADAIIYDAETKTIHVVDLKWGINVFVDVRENYQLLCYAIGVVNTIGFYADIENIELHIVQPRMNNLNSSKVTLEELRNYESFFKTRVDEALSNTAQFEPHEKACKYCPYKQQCPALFSHFEKILGFNKISMSDDDYIFVLDNKDIVIKFIESVEKHILERLLNNGTLDGYGIGESRANTSWKDGIEDELVDILSEEAYSKKLIGITEARKLLTKEQIEKLTEKPIGKPKLIKLKDK